MNPSANHRALQQTPRKHPKDKCVLQGAEGAGRCPLAGARSPVFIQDLGPEDGEVSFPAAMCLACRADYRGTCRSALVTCPDEPGGALEERIWSASSRCEGPPTGVAYLATESAYCPGPEHYSVESLDLERFVPKLLRDHGHYIKDEVIRVPRRWDWPPSACVGISAQVILSRDALSPLATYLPPPLASCRMSSITVDGGAYR